MGTAGAPAIETTSMQQAVVNLGLADQGSSLDQRIGDHQIEQRMQSDAKSLVVSKRRRRPEVGRAEGKTGCNFVAHDCKAAPAPPILTAGEAPQNLLDVARYVAKMIFAIPGGRAREGGDEACLAVPS